MQIGVLKTEVAGRRQRCGLGVSIELPQRSPAECLCVADRPVQCRLEPLDTRLPERISDQLLLPAQFLAPHGSSVPEARCLHGPRPSTGDRAWISWRLGEPARVALPLPTIGT